MCIDLVKRRRYIPVYGNRMWNGQGIKQNMTTLSLKQDCSSVKVFTLKTISNHWRVLSRKKNAIKSMFWKYKLDILWRIDYRVLGYMRRDYSVQFSSVAQSCLTLCNWMSCSMPGLLVQHQLPKPTRIHIHWVGDTIQTSHPLSSPSPPALNLSQHQGLYKWVNSLHQVATVLNVSFNISPSKEHPGLVSFRIYWLDLLSLQGTLKRLLQHYSSKA